VAATREALGLSTAATRLDSREDLFSLELSALAVPLILRDGRVTCRRSAARDLTTLVAWRKDYENSIFTGPNPGGSNATMVHRLHDDGWLFVLTADDGNLVSMCAYNAVVPDCVQIGGVWTPPDLRRRGYGRAVVAGALLQARSAGARTSVLFTDVLNEPAARAYRSLGYARVGCYSLLLFRDGHPVDGA
jgi:predicted GNAT family acetyltransferase